MLACLLVERTLDRIDWIGWMQGLLDFYLGCWESDFEISRLRVEVEIGVGIGIADREARNVVVGVSRAF